MLQIPIKLFFFEVSSVEDAKSSESERPPNITLSGFGNSKFCSMLRSKKMSQEKQATCQKDPILETLRRATEPFQPDLPLRPRLPLNTSPQT